jgi:hypothetical protein
MIETLQIEMIEVQLEMIEVQLKQVMIEVRLNIENNSTS